MFELTIKDTVYSFNFGMGFMREVNKLIKKPIDGVNGVEQNIGLQFKVASLMDNDPEALVEVLEIANKGQNPRITRNLLDSYIDDEDTDVDALFAQVLDFLSKSNATKKVVAAVQNLVEAEKAKAQN